MAATNSREVESGGQENMMAIIAVRRYAARGVALLLILGLYQLARIPGLSAEERRELAAQFRFSSVPLPRYMEASFKNVRRVHPSLERISAWVSSTGAAVALN